MAIIAATLALEVCVCEGMHRAELCGRTVTCLAVCVCEGMHGAELCGRIVRYIRSRPFSALHW